MPTSPSAPSSPSSPSTNRLVPRHDRFADGSVKARGSELDGKLHGHWEWFRIDGSLMRSGEFDLGNQVGLWRTWDRAGQLVKETSFPPASATPAASPDTPGHQSEPTAG
jgi:hypothetical protein